MGYGLSPRAQEAIENRRGTRPRFVKTARCRCRDHNPLAMECGLSVCLVSMREAGVDSPLSGSSEPRPWQFGTLQERITSYLEHNGRSTIDDIFVGTGMQYDRVRDALHKMDNVEWDRREKSDRKRRWRLADA